MSSPDSPAQSRLPSDPRLRVQAVLVVGMFACVGFKLGGALYERAAEQPDPVAALLPIAARIALLVGAIMGFAVGVAATPGLDANVLRVLTPRGLVLAAAGTTGGAVLCLGAAVLYWGGWQALSGLIPAPPAARVAGAGAGLALGVGACFAVARWVLPGLASEATAEAKPDVT